MLVIWLLEYKLYVMFWKHINSNYVMFIWFVSYNFSSLFYLICWHLCPIAVVSFFTNPLRKISLLVVLFLSIYFWVICRCVKFVIGSYTLLVNADALLEFFQVECSNNLLKCLTEITSLYMFYYSNMRYENECNRNTILSL